MRLLRGSLLAAAVGSAIGTGAATSVELVFYGLVLTVLFLAGAMLVRPRSGVITAERTPVNPPEPARLVPLKVEHVEGDPGPLRMVHDDDFER
jgi:hypothetical protein